MATANWRRSEAFRGWLMLSPPGIYALLLLALPIGTIIWLSFITQTGVVTYDTTLTLKNYGQAVGEQINRAIMLRSLYISLSVTLITVILAYPIAYFVSFHVRPEKKALWLFLITIPFWTSYLIRISLWKVILGFKGVINSALMWVGVIDSPLTFLNYNIGAVVVTLSHAYAPFAILPIYVALEKIDRSLLEASRDLGENKLVTFLRVTLPLSMAGVVGAVLIVFIPTIGDYVTPQLIGGTSGRMIAQNIYALFFDQSNRPLGAALAIVAMVCVGLSAALLILLMRKLGQVMATAPILVTGIAALLAGLALIWQVLGVDGGFAGMRAIIFGLGVGLVALPALQLILGGRK